MASAPVCHVSTDEIVFDQPRPVRLPSIPTAVDLASALTAINTLKLIVQQLSGQTPLNTSQGTLGTRSGLGVSGQSVVSAGGKTSQSSKSPQPPKQGRWVEIARSTENVRIFNPTDHTQYVDVKRINKLTFQDNVTGEIWVWTR